MTTTFKVRLRRSEEFEVEVQAEDYSDAINVAKSQLGELNVTVIQEPRLSHTSVVQTGEPWVRVSWYDLHGPGDVVVGQRATGNKFTKADVELLATRLRSLGLGILDCWNGEGCDSVSFRCSGRHGTKQFTKAEKAVLNAPREVKP